MTEPSIKGMIVQGTVDLLHKLIADRGIPMSKIEERLGEAELELLAGALNLAGWYPIRSFERISKLALELEGAPIEETCVRSGEQDARRLIDSGLYRQLNLTRDDAMPGGGASDRFETLGEMLRLSMTLSKGLYSFGEWVVVVDPDHPRRYRVEVSDAAALPDTVVMGTVGFLNECSRESRPDDPIRWSYERPRRDLVIFRMGHDY